MSKWVEEVQLDKEYQKLRQTVHKINFYRASEIVLTKDFLINLNFLLQNKKPPTNVLKTNFGRFL